LLLMDASQDYATVLREMQQFKSRYPTARIALLAEHDERSAGEMLDALRLGAHAYLAKPNCEILIKSLELLLLGETIVAPKPVAFMLHNRDKPASASPPEPVGEQPVENGDDYAANLSYREMCILRCLISGDSNKTIARKCFLTALAVMVYVRAIYRKIAVRNRTQAAIWALRHNMVGGTVALPASGIETSAAPGNDGAVAARPAQALAGGPSRRGECSRSGLATLSSTK
jgi:two-component system nitrate/nitrite response regulator NarL